MQVLVASAFTHWVIWLVFRKLLTPYLCVFLAFQQSRLFTVCELSRWTLDIVCFVHSLCVVIDLTLPTLLEEEWIKLTFLLPLCSFLSLDLTISFFVFLLFSFFSRLASTLQPFVNSGIPPQFLIALPAVGSNHFFCCPSQREVCLISREMNNKQNSK